MRLEPDPGQYELLVRGDEVIEDLVPGLPLAAALIDLFHDHAEGAGQHERCGHGKQPLTHLGVDVDGMRPVQEDKCADEGGNGAQRKPESQQAVRLAHVHSLSSITSRDKRPPRSATASAPDPTQADAYCLAYGLAA